MGVFLIYELEFIIVYLVFIACTFVVALIDHTLSTHL